MRDGALENDIVAHENTHGTTNRMTGGGNSLNLPFRSVSALLMASSRETDGVVDGTDADETDCQRSVRYLDV